MKLGRQRTPEAKAVDEGTGAETVADIHQVQKGDMEIVGGRMHLKITEIIPEIQIAVGTITATMSWISNDLLLLQIPGGQGVHQEVVQGLWNLNIHWTEGDMTLRTSISPGTLRVRIHGGGLIMVITFTGTIEN